MLRSELSILLTCHAQNFTSLNAAQDFWITAFWYCPKLSFTLIIPEEQTFLNYWSIIMWEENVSHTFKILLVCFSGLPVFCDMNTLALRVRRSGRRVAQPTLTTAMTELSKSCQHSSGKNKSWTQICLIYFYSIYKGKKESQQNPSVLRIYYDYNRLLLVFWLVQTNLVQIRK